MGGEAEAAAAAAAVTATSLAPGFRFHPTDEELVSYYLKRKVCGKPFRIDAISEIDVYKSEPWDLPDQSRLKSRDLEWYFFSALDKKYSNGSRTNRTTDQGYWKTTGKDRPVRWRNRTVGMKKTLVFHIGRAPRGERTNWVMHEYRLVDEELVNAGIAQDAFVLCRIFRKSGSGPKNGEQYGAPFIEEEWDENVLVPEREATDDALCNVGDEGYVQQNDSEQNLALVIPHVNMALPVVFDAGDGCNHLEGPRGILEDDQKLLIGASGNVDLPELPDSLKIFVLPEQYQMGPAAVREEYFVELDDLVNPVEANYHVDDPVDGDLMYFDASNDQPVNDESFLEICDLVNPVGADPSGFEMLNEYLTYFDATDDNLHYVANEDPILDQSAKIQEVNRGIGQEYLASTQPVKTHGGEGASSSKQTPEVTKLAPDVQYSEGWNSALAKRVSRMLGSIPAPVAFAAEFPTKEAALTQNSATHSSSSIHVTAEMIRISDMTVSGSRNTGSLGKGGDVNFLLSYGMTRGDVMASEHLISKSSSIEPMANMLSSKAGSMVVRSGFYLIFLWVLILSVSFKIGSYIYIR